MSTHKHFDKICLAAVVFAVVLCVLVMNGEALGIRSTDRGLGYEEHLFDTSKVHTIDIVIDDWDSFVQTAQSEEYSVCSVVIDGEAVHNVGIRGKGNTSLSSVASMDSDRYSFKIEFDQYDSTKRYHGLDKLSLNNLIQDNTYMKDYLSYRMMDEFGVAAPLCSYAWITVNGEDWGLYLAVEAVEESFLQRNYGSSHGELYKPDSMNMGGGRGNGKDFDMNDFMGQQNDADETGERTGSGRQNGGGMQMPGNFPADGFFDPGSMQMPDMGHTGGFGTGSSDVKLQYIDDDPDSYSTIFNSAKTGITEADQKRLIRSLKQLSQYENLEEVVNVDAVLRYFVVHNYLVNGDSYTGSMIHNYYLYEEDGQLSMIPWDYNLAFGTFMGGSGTSSVNDDIDEVLSDRPMQAWIFSNETYSSRYYALYDQLLDQVDLQAIIENAYELIAPYVEKDPTAFCTYEEFRTGVQTLKEFCSLRSESVRLQLSGSTETVDAGTLNLSDMGTMGNSMGGGRMDLGGSRSDEDTTEESSSNPQMPDGIQMPNGMQPPNGMQMPNGMQPPNGMQMPGGTQTSDGSQTSGGLQRPDGFANMGGFSGMPSGSQSTPGGGSAVLLVISLLFLGAGLIFAFRFKRK